jgi:hypothetical protein
MTIRTAEQRKLYNKNSKRAQRQKDLAEDAELDERARKCGIDVVFLEKERDNDQVNMFALTIADTAFIVQGGKVVEVVKRKTFLRGNPSTFEKVRSISSDSL